MNCEQSSLSTAVEELAWLNGRFIARGELLLPIDDLGFVQGVTAVERLRTWGGKIPLLARHLARFLSSADTLRIEPLPSAEEIAATLQRLVDHHFASCHFDATTSLHKPQAVPDVGLTLFATPGPAGQGKPTVAAHLNRLDHERLGRQVTFGQPLILTSILQPPPQCWPREIKVRSRLHYYLADMEARKSHPAAIGALVDTDGSVTEASTCNLFLVEDDQLIGPPADRVLAGIMGETVCRLAAESGMRVVRRPLWPEELRGGHVWLTGSEGGLWWASAVDGRNHPREPRLHRFQQHLREYLENVT